MKLTKICVLGGTGFVGRHLVGHLANKGYELKVLTRHRERHRESLVFPSVDVLQADLRDSAMLDEHFKRSDAVIFLPGILNENRHDHFKDIHAELPRRVAEACERTGVKRILHMSALNADAKQGPSNYLRTKGQGEDSMHAVARSGIGVTSFRPSVIFGHDDSFFNRFAALLRFNPVIPLACAEARFAPVYVGDVAEAFAAALNNPSTYGERLELCGPDVYTLQEIVEYTAQLMGVSRLVIPLGARASGLMAKVLQFAPGKPMTPDNLRSMQVASVCRENGFAKLGIVPKSVDAVMPLYLQGRRARARYVGFRETAGRD